MKKTFLLLFMIVAVATSTYAGGLLTNTNQSTQFIRMPSRNASLQIDGVYYNPAGLIKLEDGWHFALYNQSIWQDKSVYSSFPLLNDGDYLGKVRVPVFPTAFAVYKNNNWAFSAGFGPNAGGGSADFDEGLPTFEIPISKVVPGLAGLSKLGYNITGYDAKISFSGSSIFWGIQVGATYKLSDALSVYGGVRYLPSTNIYQGSIKDIQVNVNGTFVKASDFLSPVGNTLKTMATQATAAATSVQPLITAGAGNYTLSQVQSAGYISAAQQTALINGLVSLGVTQAQASAMTVTQVMAAYNSGATNLTTQGNTLIATATKLADKEVDTKQTGAGWTPIVGINFSPSENLNIAAKYEYKTKLELTNHTKIDQLGMFTDGGKTRSDVPGILAVGIGYKPAKWLETQFSYNLYFDKDVSWGNNVRELAAHSRITPRIIDHNYYEVALGLQFNLSDKFALSTGILTSQPGVNDSYQSDFSYCNPSWTAAGGFQWKITDQLTLDAGVLNTFYKDVKISYQDADIPGGKYSDTLGKTTFILSAGLSYSIFK